MLAFLLSIAAIVAPPQPTQQTYLKPVIDSEFWSIAGNPDLGDYTSDRQQPVDFGVWQAADGTWQLWSCIRQTRCGGNTRLFYRWEGQKLTDPNWKPMGIAMEGKPELGEHVGGLQAPHVFKHNGLYWMAYGDWENICFATSKDGKQFKRIVRDNGKTGLFGEGPGKQSRDPMLIDIDNIWYCYYTATSPDDRQGSAYCRMSHDLEHWSPSAVVSHGGQIGTSMWQNECPHVVEIEPGQFILFRNQYYGPNSCNWVYHSTNPLNFGIEDNTKLIASLKVAAPEIIHHKGQYYIASLNLKLDGIRLAKLKWQKMQRPGKLVFDFNGDGKTGASESDSFTVEDAAYTLYVSGEEDRNNCYVAIIDHDGKEQARFTGASNNNVIASRWMPGSHQIGQRMRVRIVNQNSEANRRIHFSGLYQDVPAD